MPPNQAQQPNPQAPAPVAQPAPATQPQAVQQNPTVSAQQPMTAEQQAAYQQRWQQYQQQLAASQQAAAQQPAPPQQAPNFAAPPQTQQPQVTQPGPQPQAAKKAKGKKGKKKAQTTQRQNPNSTQNALEVAEIRDDVVILNDGSFRAVTMVKSINFDLMSPEEREAVEFAFQHFINSLYFDVQISIRSRKIDMDSYIERLEKIRMGHDNMLLSLLMEDYIYYINALVDQTNIMSKEFYVTVPYHQTVDISQAKKAAGGFFKDIFSIFTVNKNTERVVIRENDFAAAKTELQNRIHAVMNGLGQININSTRLNTEALIELYYNYYNPDTAAHQTLESIDSLEAPYVTKGQGEAPKPNLRGGF